MAGELDKIFDLERLRNRWQAAPQEPTRRDAPPEVPEDVRLYQQLRRLVAEEIGQPEGIVTILHEMDELAAQLGPAPATASESEPEPESEPDPAALQAVRAQLLEQLDVLEDLIEAFSVARDRHVQ